MEKVTIIVGIQEVFEDVVMFGWGRQLDHLCSDFVLAVFGHRRSGALLVRRAEGRGGLEMLVC